MIPPNPNRADIPALLGFLRDCLAEERSRSGIRNIFASRVRARRFITGEEKATEHEFASLDLPPAAAEALARSATLRQRDAELVYATLFLVTKQNGKDVFAPLLLYPVDVSWHEESPLFQLLHGRVRLNPALFALFDLPTNFEDTILELLPGGEIGPVTPNLIAKELSAVIPSLHHQELTHFPGLLSPSKLRTHCQENLVSLLPASALALTDRSKNVAGLLHELDQIQALSPGYYPPSLLALLGQATPTVTAPTPVSDLAPALLSPAQKEIVHSVSHRPLTVCHGPPGTGKSFTIAAAALDQVARQQSVLIACRSNEAADVIHEKIRELLPNSPIVLRAGKSKHLKELKSFLDQLLSNSFVEPCEPHPWSNQGYSSPAQINTDLAALEEKLTDFLQDALVAGQWYHPETDSLWASLRRWFHELKNHRGLLLLEWTQILHRLHAKRLRSIDAFHKNLHQHTLCSGMKSPWFHETLRNYRTALGRRDAANQEASLLALDHANLLNLFPIWITTTDDIHRVLPLNPGLFDLVVIDEATQCDLASCLPILLRGKRTLLTGDPQQLRHLSFLSRDRLASLGKIHGLSGEQGETFDFRRTSLIDRALEETGTSSGTIFLSEHFRSLPELIRFSNQHFYHGSLRFMREPENLKPRPSGLKLHRLQGTKGDDGVNHAEITHTIEAYRQLLADREEDSSLPVASLGFLSPFRAQVEAFLQRVQEELPSSDLSKLLRQHDLIAGTAHSFQGAERDIVHLSLTLDPSSSASTRRFLERPDVFNVSVTRAREELHILHSLDHHDLPLDSLLQNYLLGALDPHEAAATSPSTALAHDTLPDLISTLQKSGWNVLSSQSLAGIPVDLLLQQGEQIIAIDLVGTPGTEGLPISLPKSLLLKRAGVPLLPVSIAEWTTRKEEVLAALEAFCAPRKERRSKKIK